LGVPRSAAAAAGALGATVRYGDLLRDLAQATQEADIRQHRPVRVLDIVTRPQDVEVILDGAPSRRVALVVHAEGAAQAPAAGESAQAILADVLLEGLAPGVAVERFTRSGPLALLPLPGATGVMRSLVWCCDAELARERMALDDTAFNAALQAALGTRLGRVVQCGARRSFPLLHALRDEIRAHRSVWLGNAAQTLHPVAGQGLNLGLRDCATLADSLAANDDAGTALQAYARRRGRDRQAIAMLTRALPALFATRFAPVALARSAGLVALDLAPPLRDALARLLIFGVRS
jgi:2-octaprenyl-6-methoxyphenol hydroxylase